MGFRTWLRLVGANQHKIKMQLQSGWRETKNLEAKLEEKKMVHRQ